MTTTHCRLSVLICALAFGGCASTSATPAGPRAPASSASLTDPALEAISDAVMKSFAADDIGAVYERFNGDMVRALSAHQLREVWRAVVDEAGALCSWKVAQKKREGRFRTLVIDGVHERGHVATRLAFDESNEIAGLFFAPGAP
ncbi:MAG TPA: DUF3887 domain-containing protein [Polyangia bacterium]